jgi:2-polyprenyl-3-methyl-5-hydroxy-6-metoxy-1,4-benzoquinol methylase
MLWQLCGSDVPWDAVWKQYLDTLERGGSLEPDPGLVGDREYLTAQIIGRYGSFKGLKILGAGCGTGRIEAWLAQEGAQITCLDHFMEALKVSRIHLQRSQATGHLAVGDLIKMPFSDKTFDCIYSGGVLEHFDDVSLPLKEYLRVTKAGGVIVVSVPNLVGVNAKYGAKPLANPVMRRFSKGEPPEKYFSGRAFRRAIEDAGFHCLDVSPTFFNAFDHSPFRHLRAVLSALRLYRSSSGLLCRFGHRFPGIAFGYSFMIALAEKPRG